LKLLSPHGDKQLLFDPLRSLHGFHLVRQATQLRTQQLLLFQLTGAVWTSAGVGQRLLKHPGFNRVTADDVDHINFESLAIHAKHLAVFTVPVSSVSTGLNLSLSSRRPRCSRERTVPTAQPSTWAVSA
jgi:hypothetical protein